MKLVTFTAGGPAQLGAVVGGTVVPLHAATVPSEMSALIAAWADVRSDLEAIARRGLGALDLAEVQLRAPIARPGKIMAIGLNYADHIAESGMQAPELPVWFCKASTAASGPFDPIQIPRVCQTVDYEAELVAVVGRGGRHIAVEDAPASIFGYCCGNDATERTWQLRTPQWSLGKSFDTHAPFGPWITTADEVADPHSLTIRALVNGETRQESNTRHLVFDLWEQVAHLSQAMTLEPGDLIFTGTPGGVGIGMQPPRFLTEGDVVRVEIEGLGAIENPCQKEP